jgi:menaquinone-dependent protoporphyrinogen IX oxidase
MMGNKAPARAVVYTSRLGKTRKIAKYIAKELNADEFDLKKQSVIDLSGYDHIMFGTGICAGKPYGALVSFLDENKNQLMNKKESLFISCKYDDMKGVNQLERVSSELKIRDSFFFHGKGEKNDSGMEISVDEFIKEMLKR